MATEIFVSTYPYFIGQKEPLVIESKNGQPNQVELQKLIPGAKFISDPSKIVSVMEQDLLYLSPLPRDAK